MKANTTKRRIAIATIFLIAFLPLGVRADVIPSDESQEPETKTREELPESAPSSPPLATDDTGTPGPGGYEVNLIGNTDQTKPVKNYGFGLDANFGIGERIQLRLQKSRIYQTADGASDFNGYGSTNVGVKWRFFDNKSLKIAFYPAYDFSDETRQDPAVTGGHSIYLPILISKSFGDYTVLGNVGAAKNFDLPTLTSNFVSLALGHAVSETFRIMAEVASQRTDDQRRTDVRIGAVKEIFENEKSQYETGVFGSIGESLGPTEDGQAHTSITVGFTVAKKPN